MTNDNESIFVIQNAGSDRKFEIAAKMEDDYKNQYLSL